jgi:hypothetical protein
MCTSLNLVLHANVASYVLWLTLTDLNIFYRAHHNYDHDPNNQHKLNIALQNYNLVIFLQHDSNNQNILSFFSVLIVILVLLQPWRPSEMWVTVLFGPILILFRSDCCHDVLPEIRCIMSDCPILDQFWSNSGLIQILLLLWRPTWNVMHNEWLSYSQQSTV